MGQHVSGDLTGYKITVTDDNVIFDSNVGNVTMGPDSALIDKIADINIENWGAFAMNDISDGAEWNIEYDDLKFSGNSGSHPDGFEGVYGIKDEVIAKDEVQKMLRDYLESEPENLREAYATINKYLKK